MMASTIASASVARRDAAESSSPTTAVTATATAMAEDTTAAADTGYSSAMVMEDIEVRRRLDEEYERALEEREIGYNARSQSVRQSAFFSVFFMTAYLILGTIFFVRQTDWTIPESLLFSIYTVTTVGYGNQEMPNSPGFQMYTIFYILLGIAGLTIMVAQVYQCIALEASRAQHARDKTEMARRGLDILAAEEVISNQDDADGIQVGTGGTAEILSHHQHNIPFFVDLFFRHYDRTRDFLRNNEFGRGVSVVFPLAGLIGMGAMVVGPIEGWTLVEALYFSVVSLTTVGFGDYVPRRTASIIFCIFWLPFSIGFMSIFLGNVASFYIRLSDKNIHRIETHTRRRLQRLKDEMERERAEILKRAYRGQEKAVAKAACLSDDDDATQTNSTNEVATIPLHHARLASQRRSDNFDALPTDSEDLMNTSTMFGLFGSNLEAGSSSVQRRQRILDNSMGASTADGKAQHRTMQSMKDIIDAVHLNVESDDKQQSSGSTKDGLDTGYVRARPTPATAAAMISKPHPFTQPHGALRKPSFGLRVLVQERFAEIIATDIAGYQSSIEIRDTVLSVTIDVLKDAADKWLIPRRARKAFRAVAFEALYFVGEHGLITEGAEALFRLSPFEFHGLFSPLLAAMGDAETMERWLANTDVLAEVDLRKTSAESPPQAATRAHARSPTRHAAHQPPPLQAVATVPVSTPPRHVRTAGAPMVASTSMSPTTTPPPSRAAHDTSVHRSRNGNTTTSTTTINNRKNNNLVQNSHIDEDNGRCIT